MTDRESRLLLGAVIFALAVMLGLIVAMDRAQAQEARTWNVTVKWFANTEGDLKGYRIYRQEFEVPTGVPLGPPEQIADLPADTLEFEISGITAGRYEFTLAAYDMSLNESQRSEPATVKLDEDAPMRPQLVLLGAWEISVVPESPPAADGPGE